MEPQLTDERLAWLAVRDELARKARRGGLLGRLLAGVSGRRHVITRDGKVIDTGNRSQAQLSDKMGDYAFAVDDVAQRLSTPERRTLRSTGAVPPWFLDHVEQRYAEIRARQH
jgi:hypothetical protein